MKGIGKVFLGLIFLTLFSVGFNVSVKADPTVDVSIVKDSETIEKWDEGASIAWTITVKNGDFPNKPDETDEGEKTEDSKEYTYTLVGADKEYNITVYTDSDGIHSVKVGKDGTKKPITDDELPYIGSDSIDQEAVYSKVVGKEPKKEVESFTFTATKKEGDTPVQVVDEPVTVSAYRITTTATPDTITASPKEKYLLPGQSVNITTNARPSEAKADGTESVYRLNNWSVDKENIVTLTQRAYFSADAKLSENATEGANVTANYDTVSLSFTQDLPTKISRDENVKRTIQSIGNYKAEELFVTINNIDYPLGAFTWNSQFDFTIPEDFAPDYEDKDVNAILNIVMEDDNVFTWPFTLAGNETPTDPYTVTVVVSPEDTGEATATNSTKQTDPGITIKADKGDNILLEADQDEYAFKKWEAKTSAGNKVTIKEPSSPEEASFTMPAANVTVTAYFTGEDPGIVVNDPIEVTVGQGILLSHFTDVDDVDSVSGDGKYINSRVEKQSDGDYLVTGRASTEGKEVKDGITINGESYTVLVHPRPTLITSDDIDEIIKSTIPVHVRYDDIDNKIESNYDVSYGTIGYKRDGEKYRVTTKYELSNKSSGRGTITLDWYDVSSDLKELYSTEKEEMDLELHSFPMNGSTADGNITDSNSEDLTVYRIKLLTSGGAKYKVNDKELDGTDPVFYAVEDADYEIKASAKDSSVGSLRYWEINGDRNDSTDDTKEFTAEKSRTYKAVYSTSSSSSWYGGSSNYIYSSSNTLTGRTTATGGAGGSGGDYDDVPKTGESKTDIWILWSVLLVSILGAGFMIYKRFGLVRAIAEADREEAEAVHQEMVEKQEKEKENMISTLKGLRKL